MRAPRRRKDPHSDRYEYEPRKGVSKHRDGAVISRRERPTTAEMRAAASSGDMGSVFWDYTQLGVRDWELEWPEEFPVHTRKITPADTTGEANE